MDINIRILSSGIITLVVGGKFFRFKSTSDAIQGIDLILTSFRTAYENVERTSDHTRPLSEVNLAEEIEE